MSWKAARLMWLENNIIDLVGYWLMTLVVTIFVVIIFGYDLDFKEKAKMCLCEALLMAMLIIAVWLMIGGK